MVSRWCPGGDPVVFGRCPGGVPLVPLVSRSRPAGVPLTSQWGPIVFPVSLPGGVRAVYRWCADCFPEVSRRCPCGLSRWCPGGVAVVLRAKHQTQNELFFKPRCTRPEAALRHSRLTTMRSGPTSMALASGRTSRNKHVSSFVDEQLRQANHAILGRPTAVPSSGPSHCSQLPTNRCVGSTKGSQTCKLVGRLFCAGRQTAKVICPKFNHTRILPHA